MERFPMTAQGAQKLRKELEYLKNVERPRIIQAIAEARGHGDLKENAEYHAEREKHGLNEAKIKRLESRLDAASIIDVTTLKNNGRVVFGSTVHLSNDETNKESTYQIVGEDEADLKEGKISVTSPMARALIGKEEGDEVEVKTPTGVTSYQVVKVEYI